MIIGAGMKEKDIVKTIRRSLSRKYFRVKGTNIIFKMKLSGWIKDTVDGIDVMVLQFTGKIDREDILSVVNPIGLLDRGVEIKSNLRSFLYGLLKNKKGLGVRVFPKGKKMHFSKENVEEGYIEVERVVYMEI